MYHSSASQPIAHNPHLLALRKLQIHLETEGLDNPIAVCFTTTFVGCQSLQVLGVRGSQCPTSRIMFSSMPSHTILSQSIWSRPILCSSVPLPSTVLENMRSGRPSLSDVTLRRHSQTGTYSQKKWISTSNSCLVSILAKYINDSECFFNTYQKSPSSGVQIDTKQPTWSPRGTGQYPEHSRRATGDFIKKSRN